MRYDGIDYEAEWHIMRERFNKIVRVENTLLNVYCGKEPIPTDPQWFFDLAKQLGIPKKRPPVGGQ